ncbi:MAG: rhodanese-like domain-containing protein [Chromatiaceae bacterium]|jgi:rhodanese-related sulfurtransferase|nr:rhodanese-like domain-containing protein [Chromatiaceae bacterium]
MEPTITPDALRDRLAGETPPVLLDVRRADDRAKDPLAIPGAAWHDPSTIATWASTLDPGREVVLYCARGGSVSNSVLDALLAQGLKARYIEGGLEAWKAADGELAPT